jgi:excisionase family DNA binding protein
LPRKNPPKDLDLNALQAQGRKVLYVHEVAAVLRVTGAHIIDLIEEGQIGALNVGSDSRKSWRIPITELQKFISKRSTLHGV